MRKTIVVIMTAFIMLLAPAAQAVTYNWEGTQNGENKSDFPFGTRDATIKITWGDPFARCYFYGDQDQIWAGDFNSDGYRVGCEWKIQTGSDAGRWGICVNPYGSGRVALCEKAFHAGDVLMRAGRCDGHDHPCGKPGAGSGWQWGGWHEGHNDAYNRVPAT